MILAVDLSAQRLLLLAEVHLDRFLSDITTASRRPTSTHTTRMRIRCSRMRHTTALARRQKHSGPARRCVSSTLAWSASLSLLPAAGDRSTRENPV